MFCSLHVYHGEGGGRERARTERGHLLQRELPDSWQGVFGWSVPLVRGLPPAPCQQTYLPGIGKTDVAHNFMRDRPLEKYVYKKWICIANYDKVNFLVITGFSKCSSNFIILYYITLYCLYIATTTIH